MDNHSYLFGQVAAVEELNFSVNGESVLIYTVMVKGYECLILEEDFVMKVNNSFKRDGDTDINRYSKNKLTKARQLVKAIVPVIIKDIQEIEMGTDAVSGSKIYRYLIGGSRVEGMNSLQDKYFFHKHHRRNAETVNQGDITKARVIGVSDNHLWVEAFGVETYIPSIETDIKFVDNCKKYFHVGQEIKVKVKTINVNDGKVYLSLSKRLYDLELSPFRDSLQRMKEGGAYLGVVEKMKKDIYVVRLYNNVIAVVPFEHVKADIALRIGQTVNVICFRIRKDGYIIGAAFAG